MIVLRARSLRWCLLAWIVAVGVALAQAAAFMPYVLLKELPTNHVPSGILLTEVVVMACSLLWRDVGSPVTMTTVRPGYHERLIQLGATVVLVALGIIPIIWRLSQTVPAVTIVGHAAGLLGLTCMAASLVGAQRGAIGGGLLMLALFAVAPFGQVFTWTYLPDHAGAVLLTGLGLVLAGSIAPIWRGFDPGRARRGELTGVNDS